MTENEAIKFMVLFRNEWDVNSKTKNAEALDMAIKALEKQIPKKVNVQQWICTNCDCGFEFSKHHGDGYYSIPYEKQTEYCPKCGQRLDWE